MLVNKIALHHNDWFPRAGSESKCHISVATQTSTTFLQIQATTFLQIQATTFNNI